MADVFIIGSYCTRFQNWPDKSFKDLTREAYMGLEGAAACVTILEKDA